MWQEGKCSLWEKHRQGPHTMLFLRLFLYGPPSLAGAAYFDGVFLSHSPMSVLHGNMPKTHRRHWLALDIADMVKLTTKTDSYIDE